MSGEAADTRYHLRLEFFLEWGRVTGPRRFGLLYISLGTCHKGRSVGQSIVLSPHRFPVTQDRRHLNWFPLFNLF